MQVTHSSEDNLRRFEEFRDWLLERELDPPVGEITPQKWMALRLEVDGVIAWMRSHPVTN